VPGGPGKVRIGRTLRTGQRTGPGGASGPPGPFFGSAQENEWRTADPSWSCSRPRG